MMTKTAPFYTFKMRKMEKFTKSPDEEIICLTAAILVLDGQLRDLDQAITILPLEEPRPVVGAAKDSLTA